MANQRSASKIFEKLSAKPKERRVDVPLPGIGNPITHIGFVEPAECYMAGQIITVGTKEGEILRVKIIEAAKLDGQWYMVGTVTSVTLPGYSITNLEDYVEEAIFIFLGIHGWFRLIVRRSERNKQNDTDRG